MIDLSRSEMFKSILTTLESFPVLAGRVTEHHVEHIINNLNMAAAAKRAPITIQIGGVYRNGLGHEVKIIGVCSDNKDRFRGDNDLSFNQHGRWTYVDEDPRTASDLIEVVSIPHED